MRDYTDITIVLDRSGSMRAIKDATLEGLNNFIKSQKEIPGDGCWTLVQFDCPPCADWYTTTFSQVPQQFAPVLTPGMFEPRGGTALIDAVCRAIDETGKRLAGYPEVLRPNRVLMVIMTDGEENSSVQFTAADLNARIVHQQEKYGWTFMFLGANMDAIATAAKYGIAGGNSVTYAATHQGTTNVLRSLNNATRSWKTDGLNESLFVEPKPETQINVDVSVSTGSN